MLAAPIRRTTSQLSKWNPRKSFFKKSGTALGSSQVELGKKPENGTRKRKRLGEVKTGRSKRYFGIEASSEIDQSRSNDHETIKTSYEVNPVPDTEPLEANNSPQHTDNSSNTPDPVGVTNSGPSEDNPEMEDATEVPSSDRDKVVNTESAKDPRINVNLVDYSDSDSDNEDACENVVEPSNSETRERELSPEPEKSSRPELMKNRTEPERSEEDPEDEKSEEQVNELHKPEEKKEENKIRDSIAQSISDIKEKGDLMNNLAQEVKNFLKKYDLNPGEDSNPSNKEVRTPAESEGSNSQIPTDKETPAPNNDEPSQQSKGEEKKEDNVEYVELNVADYLHLAFAYMDKSSVNNKVTHPETSKESGSSVSANKDLPASDNDESSTPGENEENHTVREQGTEPEPDWSNEEVNNDSNGETVVISSDESDKEDDGSEANERRPLLLPQPSVVLVKEVMNLEPRPKRRQRRAPRKPRLQPIPSVCILKEVPASESNRKRKRDDVPRNLRRNPALPTPRSNDLMADDISSEEENWNDHVQYRDQGAQKKRQLRLAEMEREGESSDEFIDDEPPPADREEMIARIARYQTLLRKANEEDLRISREMGQLARGEGARGNAGSGPGERGFRNPRPGPSQERNHREARGPQHPREERPSFRRRGRHPGDSHSKRRI